MTNPDKDLKNLPVMTIREAVDAIAGRRDKGEAAPRALLTEASFAEFLEALLNAPVGVRTLRTFSSPRIGLLPPPVKKDGKACYVYPDHLDRAGFVLVLRKIYHLPLSVIQELDKHFPAEYRHMVLEQKLTIEELLDMAKMLPRGFTIPDLVMAKTCDLMVEDSLPSAKALLAATQPGAALRRTEEEAILGRLEEIKKWVVSGRRQQFVARESAQDFQNLAQSRLMAGKIVKKIMAKRARLARGARK